jgi:hypothetical protein
MERVKIADVGADLGLASCKNNTETLGSPLPLNKTYFENYMNARYSEEADYNPNSPANVLREVHGLPKQGKLITRVSMYANRYPSEDALKLFGPHADAGAQLPR